MKVYTLTYCERSGASGPIGAFSSMAEVDGYLLTLPSDFDDDKLCLCEEELNFPTRTSRRWECRKGSSWVDVTEDDDEGN